MARLLTETEFLATLREPLRRLDRTPERLARVAPHVPPGAVVTGISESFDGMYTHVLIDGGPDRHLTFVIDNAAGQLRGYFMMAL